jgi:hypothetical protein
MTTGTPALSERIGDLVAAVHKARHGGNANEVHLEIEVDGLDIFVRQYNLITIPRDGAGHRQQACKRRV